MQIYREYLNTFEKIGINKGDVLYLASDLLRTIIYFKKKKKKLDLNRFLNTFIFYLGEKGTLVLPTFNWDYCAEKTFDIKNTKSKCGSLSNLALKRDDFCRTKHPIYSFAVHGKYKDYLCNLNNRSAWGKNSPFSFLNKIKAKNLFIGLDYKKAFTMDHYYEQYSKVKYRYHKKFISYYIDKNKKKTRRTYSMFVRKVEMCDATAISSKLDNILLKNNSLFFLKKNGSKFSMVNIFKAGKILIKDLKKDKSKLIYPIKFKNKKQN